MTELKPAIGILWREKRCLTVGMFGLGKVSLFLEGVAELDPDMRQARIDRQCRLIGSGGLCPVPVAVMRVSLTDMVIRRERRPEQSADPPWFHGREARRVR